MHESPWRCTPCRYQLHVRIYACTTSTAFALAPCSHQIRMHHTNSLHSWSFASAINNANQPPPLPLFCPLILTQSPFSLTGCYLVLFPWLCILFTWRSLQKQNDRAQGCTAYQAWRGAEALFSCLSDKQKKRAQLGTASRRKAFPGGEVASLPWPGRDWQTCPGRALANDPRQGTGKASRQGMQ